jgi:hypothetical protein
MKLACNNQLFLVHIDDGISTSVKVVKCFPLTHKTKYLSLVDKEGKEIAFIDDMNELSTDNYRVLNEYLDKLDFQYEITDITNIQEDFGLRHWEVNTQAGETKFQTSLIAWPKFISKNKVLIQDLNGDKFFIPDVTELDSKSYEVLKFYIE